MGKLRDKSVYLICENYITGDPWQSAITFLNDRNWQLNWYEVEGGWHLLSGSQLIFMGKTWAELEACIYGMVLNLRRNEQVGRDASRKVPLLERD